MNFQNITGYAKIKRLGGQIIEKPIDNCIILTEELKGNKVKIGKEF